MNRLITITALSLVSILMVQCSSTKNAPTGMTDAQKVDEVKKNYTSAQLQEGKTIWQASCQKCHALYPADSRTVNKWERVLPRMNKRANLDDVQAGKVRAYLLVNAASN